MVSPKEWAASESIAEEPEARPATSLAAAIRRLAAPATSTVEVDSSSAMHPAYPSHPVRRTGAGHRIRSRVWSPGLVTGAERPPRPATTRPRHPTGSMSPDGLIDVAEA